MAIMLMPIMMELGYRLLIAPRLPKGLLKTMITQINRFVKGFLKKILKIFT